MENCYFDLLEGSAQRHADRIALRHKGVSMSYAELRAAAEQFAGGLVNGGLRRNDRVAILVNKNFEYVISVFGTSAAGGVFVPVNTLLKAEQVAYILDNCDVSVLVTTRERCVELLELAPQCPQLRKIVVVGGSELPSHDRIEVVAFESELQGAESLPYGDTLHSDMAAILYTSGSTGKPKGVVLSHLNMLVGASSVAGYIGNQPSDRILAVLPFSFDAGLSQLSTGIYSGACVILHDFFLPGDVVKLVEKEGVTGITGVPPLWIQLAEQNWPGGSTATVRYFANTGGKMPMTVLARLREVFPEADPFLMYGLTESFRSTYLPPSEAENRPESIGKAIPNAEILVVTKDGTLAEPGQVGELVHRGPLVSMGYWNDPERTAQRFRPAPGQPPEIPIRELAVWSGDFVSVDEDGYLYFVGRQDDMIKTSGYRVSPAEVEECIYASGFASVAAALGLPDERLGQVIVIVAKANDGAGEPTEELLAYLRKHLPNYMVPARIEWRNELPRNANGKLDRPLMVSQLQDAGS